jgi:hypothetical protein
MRAKAKAERGLGPPVDIEGLAVLEGFSSRFAEDTMHWTIAPIGMRTPPISTSFAAWRT